MSLRLTVDAEDLRAAVDFTSKLCATNPRMPILHGLLVEADERLTLSAFDGDLAGCVSISACVLDPGRALIPGRVLAQIVKTVGERHAIDIACRENRIVIGDGRNVSSLLAMPERDYPQLPTPCEASGELDGEALRRAILRVLPAAERPGHALRFGASVDIVSEGDTLALCGYDGYRAGVCRLPWKSTEGEVDALVPAEVLKAAASFLGPEGAVAEVGTDQGRITLATGSHRLTGPLTAERWSADWRRSLPVYDELSAVFVVDELRAAVERVIAISDDRCPRMIMMISAEGGFELRVSADDREGVAVAGAADYYGESRKIALNQWYLRDALAALGTDLGALRLGPTATSAFDVIPLDKDGMPDPTYRHLIMPIRLPRGVDA